MPTAVIENYLKHMHALAGEGGDDAPRAGGRVAIGELAASLAVTPGSVTSMVKKLAARGLASYERYGGASLTAKGRREALRVLRRHRIVETFLVQTLGFDWSEVHEEAERLEHALSDAVIDRLDALLDRPVVDPHGDPIPQPDGAMARQRSIALADCAGGDDVRVVRIVDQDAEFLRFVAANGLRPGARVRVERRDRAAESMRVRSARREPMTIAFAAARKVMVER